MGSPESFLYLDYKSQPNYKLIFDKSLFVFSTIVLKYQYQNSEQKYLELLIT
ncbi:MAG: hypothetical protein ACJA1H_002106 [Glaciecola sp.]|jgi:hypothetical protein